MTGPAELERAHRASIRHRAAILASNECGCFYCLARFAPAEIESWADAGETALCPRCGIDSVLGDGCGVVIDDAFLAAMRRHWF
jgi:hypothetical protein